MNTLPRDTTRKNRAMQAQFTPPMKTCRVCEQDKALINFPRDKSRPDGFHPYCRPCKKLHYPWRREAQIKARKPPLNPPPRTHCGKGHEFTPENTYDRSNGGRRCRACIRSHSLKYKRNYHLLWHYGITYEDYQALLERQGGVCAICGKPPKDGRILDVDHSHNEGHVRGLLCSPCNVGIGHFEDKPQLLQAAIKYLQARGVVV